MNHISLEQELKLLLKLIYSNKNQHHASIWFRKSVEIKRWSNKLLLKLKQSSIPTNQFLEQFETRLLKAYNSILQNLARTAFMAIGMTFITSFSRIHSIVKHLQSHQPS
ncbi:hypothetical protein PCANC_15063 [Puccinia coronata f. sp. avenae]|uniref:Uncharacterized protein n=1 Tax=Puccinia coronata f. sp. avenae TaxID=200324 RepID=A0A2N5TVE8_9BASI|nr:hypothetical protein PCASD_16796 [Puccinia coronata f. sp. avenae]PLW34718.1 hypothetical protein PCANC_15063 [Puccinia coronata f. sp. avenae]